MDLTKKIDLYFGNSPVKGDTQNMQSCLDKETEFCAVYTKNDLPADINNRTNAHMLNQFGVHSQFAKDNKSYVRPYLINNESNLASTGGFRDATTETLKGSGFRVGGTFFCMSIAETVLTEFKRLGYAVEKKYE